jgi:CBS domain-containing protein
MRRSGVKRIPVLDGSGKLVGIVSRSDILRAFVRPDGEIVDEINGELLRKILWIDPKRVDIICEDGNVSLSGRLETRSDAQLLIELTRRLDGVVSVADGLRWEVDNTKVEMTTPPPVARLW